MINPPQARVAPIRPDGTTGRDPMAMGEDTC